MKLSEIEWTLAYFNSKGLKTLDSHATIQTNGAMSFIKEIPFDRWNINKIADIGSGPGHQAFILHCLDLEVVCIDYVQPQYHVLEWRHPDDIKDISVDAVWSHHSLEHIKNPLAALASWNKLLPVTGSLFITVPAINLTMSSGHINNYNIPLLMYHLALSGFDVSKKMFTQSESHIRSVSTKTDKFDPKKKISTSLKDLAAMGLFPPSVTTSIEKTGRFDCENIVLDWFGHKRFPQRGSNEFVDYAIRNVWKPKD